MILFIESNAHGWLRFSGVAFFLANGSSEKGLTTSLSNTRGNSMGAGVTLSPERAKHTLGTVGES
jgi:hypothetical protein